MKNPNYRTPVYDVTGQEEGDSPKTTTAQQSYFVRQ